MADLAGVNLAMQTPFNDDGSINLGEWERLIDAYIDAGVHGLVLGSGTGQHPYLTEAEANKLYETGIKRVDGRCNVICQSSALNMDEVIRRSKHAQDNGADAIMVLPPYLEGPSDDDGIFEFYRVLDDAVSIDIVGYNIPQATGLAVSPNLLERLAELKNYNYIKDSGGDLFVHQQYLQSKCKVLNGADTIALYAFMGGSVGAIWGAANYMPHEAVALYDHVAAKDYAAALALWQKMLPSLLYAWGNEYAQCVLTASKHRGYGTGNVRAPLRPIPQAKQEAMIKTLEPLFEAENV